MGKKKNFFELFFNIACRKSPSWVQNINTGLKPVTFPNNTKGGGSLWQVNHARSLGEQ